MRADEGLITKLKITERKTAFVAGTAGLLSLLGWIAMPQSFAQSYITAYFFMVSLTVGAFPVIFFHYLTGGNWGYSVRRLLEIMTKLLPLLLVFFIPILFHLKTLFLWANADIVSQDKVLQAKSFYLNVPLFVIRALIYFSVWGVLSYFANRWSSSYDAVPSKKTFGRLQTLGGLGLILYALTVTFSSYDWGMSLEPHWYSSMYGFLFMAGETLASYCACLFLLSIFRKEHPFKWVLTPERSHDLGNLLFAFVMIWAYLSISQFIIIWNGNLQEEVPWYLHRSAGGWKIVAIALAVFHFVIPFFLLLMRAIKKNFQWIGGIAFFVLLMRWIDLLWTLKPSFPDSGFHWLDITLLITLAGAWFFGILRLLRQEKLVLNHDPIFDQEGNSHAH